MSMSAKDRVVANAIRSIVYQNTAPDGPLSSESSKQLAKYLQTPETKDIVYAKIVERIATDKTRNEMIVRRAVNIMKANLTNYVPSSTTLAMLDKFCLSIVTDNDQILRSISYVRSLIHTIMKKLGFSKSLDDEVNDQQHQLQQLQQQLFHQNLQQPLLQLQQQQQQQELSDLQPQQVLYLPSDQQLPLQMLLQSAQSGSSKPKNPQTRSRDRDGSMTPGSSSPSRGSLNLSENLLKDSSPSLVRASKDLPSGMASPFPASFSPSLFLSPTMTHQQPSSSGDSPKLVLSSMSPFGYSSLSASRYTLVHDFLITRKPPPQFPKKASSLNILVSALFGGQFRRTSITGAKVSLEPNDTLRLPVDSLASSAIQAISIYKKSETNSELYSSPITDLPKISHESLELSPGTSPEATHQGERAERADRGSPTARGDSPNLVAPGSPSSNRNHFPLPGGPSAIANNLSGSRNLTSSTGNLHAHLGAANAQPSAANLRAKLTPKNSSFNASFSSGSPRARPYSRRGGLLFHYKYYKSQQALNLTHNELELVLAAVYGNHGPDTRLVADQIIIKLFMDIYTKSTRTPNSIPAPVPQTNVHSPPRKKPIYEWIEGQDSGVFNIIFAVMMEMLQSRDIESRVHAFDLLFNLSIHINLFEEIKMEDSPHAKNTAPDAPPSNTYKPMERLQGNLFCLLNDMLLYILHRREAEARVWQAALSLTLYFICTIGGNIYRKQLAAIDARVIVNFIKYSDPNDDVLHRHLVRMLVNLLYKPKIVESSSTTPLSPLPDAATSIMGGSKLESWVGEEELDTAVLELVGVDFLIEVYSTTRSQEVRNNLFLVLMDITVRQVFAKEASRRNRQGYSYEPPHQQVSLLLECLKRLDAPTYFPIIYHYLPEKFMDDFVKTIFFEQIKRDSALAQIAPKIDRHFAVKLFHEIERLAREYQKMAPEFERSLESLCVPEAPTDGIDELYNLISSNVLPHKRQGAAFLFALMRAPFDQRPLHEQLAEAVEQLIKDLLDSPEPPIRRIYITLVAKLVLLAKSKMQSFTEESLKLIFFIFNDHLLRVVTAGEKTPANLLYMLDIITDFITIRLSSGERDIKAQDTVYGMLLRGLVVASRPLLNGIDIKILHHIFNYLPATSEPRLVVLHFLIDKCKTQKSCLESLGGIAFFIRLLADSHAPIAYYVAHFLLERFAAERPDSYRIILSQLLSKAVESNNEQLVSNPYFQFRAILELSASKKS
eukprot:Phypoly_transcript_00445.p1 GENE.Phypoly_transcript_00445~~Phypoly_transcript_00445.p1  ORF type:complete len:1231 (+),score=179.96 Phypoly_transcript_00445:1041-4733(+)